MCYDSRRPCFSSPDLVRNVCVWQPLCGTSLWSVALKPTRFLSFLFLASAARPTSCASLLERDNAVGLDFWCFQPHLCIQRYAPLPRLDPSLLLQGNCRRTTTVRSESEWRSYVPSYVVYRKRRPLWAELPSRGETPCNRGTSQVEPRRRTVVLQSAVSFSSMTP